MKKEQWFFEKPLPGSVQNYKIGLRVRKRIYSEKTKHQIIEILETFSLGRVFILDGIIQLSEKYEFIYHEMISHLPIFYHPFPERLLIIGGGDGGVVREALKHPLKEIFWVEIDDKVIDISKRYLPFLKIKESLKDKRVRLFFDDGFNFVKKFKNFFDVIIVDSTDPFGPSLSLFQRRFYRQSFQALKKEGVFITQSGNFLDQIREIRNVRRNLEDVFPYVKIHRVCTPDYQGSDFSFILGSKKENLERFDFNKIKKRFKKIKKLKYYSPEMHFASGVLPKFYKEVI